MQTDRIESKDNRRLIHARKVRDGKVPGSIFIEGRRLVEEALHSGVEIENCFVSDSYKGPLVGLESISSMSEKLFRTIADTDSPQGIALIAKRPRSAILSTKGKPTPLIIYLSSINNPSNLGAIMRTAEAAGAAGLITSPGSADPYSPRSLRASMGSAFRLPIQEEVFLKAACQNAREQGMSIIAADARGGKNYLEIDWKKPHLLVFGSEAHGLDDEQLRAIDETITILTAEPVESLNLAVSAAIILFEARRQMLG